MDTATYFEIYHELVSRGTDTDEARCIVSDIEEAVSEDPSIDPWEYMADVA